MNQEKEEERLVGLVERIMFKNEDTGYHVLSVGVKDLMEEIKVTINQPNIFEGLTYEFKGEYIIHPRFGNQFKATIAFEVLPSTKEGLKAYLSSSFFPGIGPVIAGKIIDYFGDKVMDVFNNNIEKLIEIPGISKRKLEAIKASWEENKEVNDVMVFLQQNGISTLYASKIYKFYGKKCVAKIMENPYLLAKDIAGIGFKYADKVALNLGFAKDGFERVKACVHYVLEQGTLDGHCYLTKNQIISKSSEYIGLEIKSIVEDALVQLERIDDIKVINESNENRYYSKKLYYNEIYCAEKINALKETNQKVKINDSWLDIPNDPIKLSPEQKEAVVNILGKGISVLTGGPGSGKTTTTKKLVRVLLDLGKGLVLAAPTGRAAQRMTEVIGFQASTIHRLLGWDHENKSFLKNESNPIQADFIIIDESSMIDINLAASLLRAIPHDCQVLFIGDADQLPPVGPGDFFSDLISSGAVPVFKLNKIFRQGEESLIIKYAHEINSGKTPNIESPLLTPSLWKNNTDCTFIDSGIKDANHNNADYPKWSSLRYNMGLLEMITNLYTETIPKYFGEDKEIQILIPMNIGDLGCIKVNEIIQAKVNPPSKEKEEIKIKERIFRCGDKVIQKANNYDLNVFNGDIGKITEVDSDKTEISVLFSEDREVLYRKSDILELDLAYAISIHKSQGSEFDCIVIPIMMQYSRMLQRNLIYTGLTRAKKLAVFVGQRKPFEIAVNNAKYNKRQTNLKEFLKKESIFNSFI